MTLSLDCIPCIINSILRLLKDGMLPQEQHESALRRVLDYLATADYSLSPPALGRDLHRLIREILDDPDPYADIKSRTNRMMLELLPQFRQQVADSDTPFDTALRLAIAGNVIDFGPQHQLDVMQSIDRVMNATLAVDDSKRLQQDLAQARSVLYICDNAGEIVFDRLFIETLDHPNLTAVVRGGPVINDATMEDAERVGLTERVEVTTTGDNAPGAVWETAGDAFKERVERADVIIAKGQGNLEGLLDHPFPIFFLLTVKCDLIGERIGASRGDFCVKGPVLK